MIKDGLNSPPNHEKVSQATSSASVLGDLINHETYFNYTQDPLTNTKPTFLELQNYLRDAYLGLVPIPLNAENLSKSYAYFGGSQHKLTLHKILSKKELAFNLIPGLEELENKQEFDLEWFREFVCQPETVKEIDELKRLIHLNNQKAISILADTFQNPTLAISALKAVSKKQWGQLLVKAPSNQHLLQATAKLSSKEFFENGMHIAFLELEPEIYGALTKEASIQIQPGFQPRKYTRLILELELLLKQLKDQQLNNEKYKVDNKLYKKADAAIQENEIRTTGNKPTAKKSTPSLELPQERPSFIQKVVREELGYDIPINRLQVQRILEAADEILKEPNRPSKPIDFLHNKHPEPKEEIITFDNMDLSSR